jgi:hypothetical protein
MTRRPLPSAGSLGMVPRLRRYYGTLRLPTVRLAAFRCLHLAIPSLRPSFVPLDGGRATGGLGVSGSGLPAGITMETIGSLRFPGNPRDHCPCSATPVGSSTRFGSSCHVNDAAPAHVHNEGSPRLKFSGLNHTASDLAVYASRWRSPATTQDSLLAAGPALPGGIGYPQGSNEGFPSSRLFLPSQAFPDARTLQPPFLATYLLVQA